MSKEEVEVLLKLDGFRHLLSPENDCYFRALSPCADVYYCFVFDFRKEYIFVCSRHIKEVSNSNDWRLYEGAFLG